MNGLVNSIIFSNREHEENSNYIVSLRYKSGNEAEDISITSDINDMKAKEMLDFLEIIDENHYYYVETQIGDNGIAKEIIIYYNLPDIEH